MTGVICTVPQLKTRKDIQAPVQEREILLFKQICKCKFKTKCYLPSTQMILKQLCHYRIAKITSWTLWHKQFKVSYQEIQYD